MPTFIILSQFEPDAFEAPADLKARAESVSTRIEDACDVTWKHSYATTGTYDVVDIVEASDAQEVMKASLVLRALGSEHTETLAATPWKDFVESV
jgi:uncharacterized protein with GYD domain